MIMMMIISVILPNSVNIEEGTELVNFEEFEDMHDTATSQIKGTAGLVEQIVEVSMLMEVAVQREEENPSISISTASPIFSTVEVVHTSRATVQDKGKGIMIEEELPKKVKLRTQAHIDYDAEVARKVHEKKLQGSWKLRDLKKKEKWLMHSLLNRCMINREKISL